MTGTEAVDEPRQGDEPATEPRPVLRMIGDGDTLACEGDSCVLPAVPPQD